MKLLKKILREMKNENNFQPFIRKKFKQVELKRTKEK